jgi:hypothetical protein
MSDVKISSVVPQETKHEVKAVNNSKKKSVRPKRHDMHTNTPRYGKYGRLKRPLCIRLLVRGGALFNMDLTTRMVGTMTTMLIEHIACQSALIATHCNRITITKKDVAYAGRSIGQKIFQ